jgi:hypothetical protein
VLNKLADVLGMELNLAVKNLPTVKADKNGVNENS